MTNFFSKISHFIGGFFPNYLRGLYYPDPPGTRIFLPGSTRFRSSWYPVRPVPGKPLPGSARYPGFWYPTHHYIRFLQYTKVRKNTAFAEFSTPNEPSSMKQGFLNLPEGAYLCQTNGMSENKQTTLIVIMSCHRIKKMFVCQLQAKLKDLYQCRKIQQPTEECIRHTK